MVSLLNIDIYSVASEGNDEACASLDTEEHLFYLVGLLEDVLLGWHESLLKVGTYPAQEVVILASQKGDYLVILSVDMHAGLDFQSVGQLV